MGKKKTVMVGGEEPQKKGQKVKVPGLKGGQKVKLVSSEADEGEKAVEPVKAEGIAKKGKKAEKRPARARGRKYRAARAKVETGKTYAIEEAVELAKKTHIGSFVGKIGVNLTLKDNLNTQIELPYSCGKTKNVEVASEETLAKLDKGVMDFDMLLATPAMMPKLAKYAKLLGPKGLFPNPKNGTVVEDPEKAKVKFGGNNVRIATEKGATVVHLILGKTDQKTEELAANLKVILAAIPGRVGLVKAVVAATMGPGVRVKL